MICMIRSNDFVREFIFYHFYLFIRASTANIIAAAASDWWKSFSKIIRVENQEWNVSTGTMRWTNEEVALIVTNYNNSGHFSSIAIRPERPTINFCHFRIERRENFSHTFIRNEINRFVHRFRTSTRLLSRSRVSNSIQLHIFLLFVFFIRFHVPPHFLVLKSVRFSEVNLIAKWRWKVMTRIKFRYGFSFIRIFFPESECQLTREKFEAEIRHFHIQRIISTHRLRQSRRWIRKSYLKNNEMFGNRFHVWDS